MPRLRPLALPACLLALPLAAGCGTPEAAPRTPLLDGLHAPEVLTEATAIELPPSLGGNRFLDGWFGWRRRGEIWLVPDPEAERSRLEYVTLDGRARRLEMLLEIGAAEPDATVAVRVAGRELEPLPLERDFEVPLPTDLPPGRVPVEIDFGAASLSVEAAGLGHAWRPGAARFEEDGRIVQSGYSAIDFPRRLERPARLAGRFLPPRDPEPDQRFTVVVETPADGAETVFEWRPGWWSQLRGRRAFDAELPQGPVRVRLLAQGIGPPGRWSHLGLGGGEPAPVASPGAAPEPPRLVVLYILDALRADALGHLGGRPEASPVIDRLAAEGATFTDYATVAADTIGSTKALLTGRPVVSYEVRGQRLADEIETLGELFSARGYRTAVFTSNHHVTQFGATRGFEHHGRSAEIDIADGLNDSAGRVHAAALSWLDAAGDQGPAFLYLHTINPHNPYTPPAPFPERFTADIDSSIDGSTETLQAVKRGEREVDDADRERLAALYLAGVAYNDAELGLLIDELGRRFEPGEVALFITSDHGEELFDHDGLLHGYTLYREQLHVPLVVWWPGRVAPRRVAARADNLDLNATLRALLELPAAPGGGRSLWPAIFGGDGAAAAPAVRFAAAGVPGGMYMAASERAKLVWAPRRGAGWGMGEGRGRTRAAWYLFDLETDPGETVNLAGADDLEAAWLRSRLAAWIERSRLGEVAGEEVVLDEATRAQLRALGYLD